MTTPLPSSGPLHGDVETVGVAVQVAALPRVPGQWWAASNVKEQVTLVRGSATPTTLTRPTGRPTAITATWRPRTAPGRLDADGGQRTRATTETTQRRIAGVGRTTPDDRPAAPGRSVPTPGWSRTCTTATGPIPPRCPTRGASSSPTTGRPARRPATVTAAPTADRVPSGAGAATASPSTSTAPSGGGSGRGVPAPAVTRNGTGSPAVAGGVVAEAKEGPEPAVPLRGAAGRIVANMEASLGVPTATSVRVGAGQAPRGQPHHRQQPAVPDHRRQGQLHPPDRLRRGQGADRRPGHERRLRGRRRRQGDPRGGPPPPRRAGPGRRRREVRRQPHPAGAVHHRRRLAGLPGLRERLRGAGAQDPHQQDRARRLRRHHGDPDQPGHARHRAVGPPAHARARGSSSASVRSASRPGSRPPTPAPWPIWASARR